MGPDPDHQEARTAAEVLLQSSSSTIIQNVQSPITDASHTYSINTMPSMPPDYIISPEFLTGQRLEGRMSSVRRFFCLFVTFDLAFTCLMWLICIMITGQNMSTAIDKQIYHYDVHSSLFDVVFASICRFIFLILFYGCIHMNHWIVIAISTAATCGFLIFKVFVYQWVSADQPVFQVMLILTSFVISWSEAWFWDFRVLPQEFYASQYFVNAPNVRTPLIHSYVQGLPSMYTESVGNYYSPLCSPEGSVHETEGANERYPPVRFSKEQEDILKAMGAKTLKESWNIMHNCEWKLEKSQGFDTVHTTSIPQLGKVFKLTALLDAPAEFLLEDFFYKVEQMSQWNSALLESYKVQTIDEFTDIVYQISVNSVGVVSSRDFVTIRHWGLLDQSYVIAYSAVEHPSCPKHEKYTRAENKIGCWSMQPMPNDPSKCQFVWVLNTDLKLWIPRYLLDTAFTGMMFNYARDLRKYIGQLRQIGRL